MRFRKVLELEPGWSDATCRLGDVRAADGDLVGALEAWDEAPYNPDCVESSGRALLDTARPAEALQRFVTLRRLLSQDPRVELLVAQALAPTDPEAAVDAVQRYLARGGAPSPDLVPAIEAVCAALKQSPDRALDLVDRAVAVQPDAATALDGVRDRFEIEVRADELMGAAPVALDGEGRQALEGARRKFAAGDVPGALAGLEGLADRVSRNPDVWAALADVREASGDIEGAERAIVLARRLSPMTSRFHARHGELLATHYGGRYDGEAAALLRRALEGGEEPDTLELYARVTARAGQWDVARDAWRRLGERWPDDAERARREVASLERSRPVPPELPAVPPPDGVDPDAWRATHRAWALRDRGDPDRGDLDRALDELDDALAAAPGLTKALNLRAQIHLLRGDRAAAIAGFRASLDVDRDPAVLATLADLLRQDGQIEEADRALREAADAGSGVAIFRMAERHAASGRWWTARTLLDAYFRNASSGPVHAEALGLRAQLDRNVRNVWVAVGATALAAVLVPAWFVRRRRAGVGVAALLERSPRAFREVARIVSSIRHEVLKHNVSALPGVADALEDGDPGPASFAAARLYGPDGAIARFGAYVTELEELGRTHGVTLNLAWRDPTFGPLLAGFARLSAVERRLEAGGPRVVAELRAISTLLAEDGYRALGELLRGVCVVTLTPHLFERALADVVREAAFRRVDRPEWSVDVPPGLAVRAYRGDLHDILVNLLRNALQASVEAGTTRLAVRLAVEEDPVTGIERVELRVLDDAPRRISTAMIRGRYIERGLGLAVDLTSRAGGSIHVEDEPGWSKAVVVRLPREELT